MITITILLLIHGNPTATVFTKLYICDRIPQNESEVATGKIEKTSRKGSFPDFRRFWDDFIFSIYILLTTSLALQEV